MSQSIIKISKLNKQYKDGFQAVSELDLDIEAGEIFALLGPNGAGKTTLISMICGLTNVSSGTVTVKGFDLNKQQKEVRKLIGLVPQEITINMFETVRNTLNFSRGLFDLKRNPDYIDSLLKKLSLWDKQNSPLMTLSGGMKRRVMIAKALAHEPKILFLDEPSAGVDVSLRRDMWDQIRELKGSGVTIILTTHYIEEAEVMADRIGVINKGKLIVVEEKNSLIKKLGKKRMTIELSSELVDIPSDLASYKLKKENNLLIYDYDPRTEENHISRLFCDLQNLDIGYKDIKTKQSSLEDIFLELVEDK